MIYILIMIQENVIAIKESIIRKKMETPGKIVKLINIDLITIFINTYFQIELRYYSLISVHG